MMLNSAAKGTDMETMDKCQNEQILFLNTGSLNRCLKVFQNLSNTQLHSEDVFVILVLV